MKHLFLGNLVSGSERQTLLIIMLAWTKKTLWTTQDTLLLWYLILILWIDTNPSNTRFSFQSNRPLQPTDNIDIGTDATTNYGDDSVCFRAFVYQHIKVAFNDGFNDNIGRTNVQPVFELPKLSVWYKVYDALYDAFFYAHRCQTASTTISGDQSKLQAIKVKINQYFTQLKPHIDIDSKFSMNRCKKVLPNALNIYQDNLPQHYTRVHHEHKLEKAIHAFRYSCYAWFLSCFQKDCLSNSISQLDG